MKNNSTTAHYYTKKILVKRVYDQLGRKDSNRTILFDLQDQRQGIELHNSLCNYCFHDYLVLSE